MTLGDIIKKYRTENGFSMEYVAQKCGITKGYVAMLERNVNSKTGRPVKPSIETIIKICNGLHFNFNEVFAQLDDDYEISIANYKPLTLVPAKSASAPQHAPDLPPDEQRLLDIYRDLSDDGKAALLNYAEERTMLEEYKKRSPNKQNKLSEGSGQSQLRENIKYDFGDMPLSRVAESVSKYKKGK